MLPTVDRNQMKCRLENDPELCFFATAIAIGGENLDAIAIMLVCEWEDRVSIAPSQTLENESGNNYACFNHIFLGRPLYLGLCVPNPA